MPQPMRDSGKRMSPMLGNKSFDQIPTLGNKMHPMTLRQYMDEHKIGLDDMASLLGMSVSGLRKNLNGERFPRLALLKRVEEVTKGSVTAKDFVAGADNPPPAEPDTKNEAAA